MILAHGSYTPYLFPLRFVFLILRLFHLGINPGSVEIIYLQYWISRLILGAALVASILVLLLLSIFVLWYGGEVSERIFPRVIIFAKIMESGMRRWYLGWGVQPGLVKTDSE